MPESTAVHSWQLGIPRPVDVFLSPKGIDAASQSRPPAPPLPTAVNTGDGILLGPAARAIHQALPDELLIVIDINRP
jgi:hypothetical protein